MYAAALILHSWIRWAALVAGVGATILGWHEQSGSMRSRTDWWGRVLVGALDVQLLLGLWLYLALSPFTAGVRSNVEVVMADPTLRFWNVEHPAEIGRASCRERV